MKNALPSLSGLLGVWGLIFLPCLSTSLTGQILRDKKYFSAETSYAIKLGTTRSLRQSPNVVPTDPEKLKQRKANKPQFIPNFAGRRPLTAHNPNALPKGADPLFQDFGSRTLLNDILPVVNVEGISNANSSATPPDVNGDVGRDFYVEIVNATRFRVYDKMGNAVSGLFNANTIWSQVQETSAGDPILLYDQAVDRWFLTEFPSGNKVLVAISHSSDPLGQWDAYAFQTPRFPDFPKYGIWRDAYYLTTNEFGGNFPIYAINREDILAGVDTARIQRLTIPKIGGVFFEVGQPVDWDGMQVPPEGSPGLVVKLNDDDWGTTTQDVIQLLETYIDWNNQSQSYIEVTSIPSTPYNTDGCSLENTGGFSCIPQPNGQGIDGAEWIITNKAQYRNFGTHESFVMSFMVDATGNEVAGIRWIEFRKTASQPWTIYQEGTVGSDDGLHRFMSSIGIDGKGNIGLAYSVSGWDKFPSLRFTGRYSTDPLGTMTFKEFEFGTGNGSQGFDRFGDYASMSVDPADDETFWFAGQYLPEDNFWGTRIVAFKAFRDSIDVFPIALISPANDGTFDPTPVHFSILNRGHRDVSGFPAAYQFNNGEWIQEGPHFDTLQVDSTIIVAFDSLIHFDTPGVFPIRIATLLDMDLNRRNDTLTFYITKFARTDIALEYVEVNGSGIVCSEESVALFMITNAGLDTISSLSIEILRGGIPFDTILWSGSLAAGQVEQLVFSLVGLQLGDNAFTTGQIMINGGPDEVRMNDEVQWTISAQPEGVPLTLIFKTDNFPSETSWKLFDDAENIIATGGPFADLQTIYTTDFCLDPEACYTFTVYDVFGDGLSQGTPGDFQIINEEGGIVAELIRPNFGKETSNAFCLTDTCLIDLQVGVQHASAPGVGDAFVLAEISNALGTVMYSLDGGITFQTSNTFDQLATGQYSLIAVDGAGCKDTVEFNVLECNLQASISTLPAVGGDVGQIHIATSGGIQPIEYSLQGGSFSSDSFFIMLEPGDYEVVIRDSLGCVVVDTVSVTTTVSTHQTSLSYFIRVSPNPGKGMFQVEARLNEDHLFAEYEVVTTDGQPLFFGSLVRYDQQHHGTVSLAAYPDGVYYIIIRLQKGLVVHRIIKAG